MRVSVSQVTLHRRANNGAPMTPTLLLTRPDGRNASFASAVRAAWQGPLDVISSPLLSISFLPAEVPEAEALIFTSVNGVDAAASLAPKQGMKAWCVGGRTADAARAAGFAPEIGPGDADGLVRHIISARPAGRLAHIRGRHTRGDVAGRLTAAGLICDDVVAYDQLPCPPSVAARAALSSDFPVVAPLFSPRTATILIQQGPFAAPVHVVAMSEAVKEAAAVVPLAGITVAASPEAESMVEAVVATLGVLGTKTG